jgi:hypothetical protein
MMLNSWEKMEKVFQLPSTSIGLKTLVCSGKVLPPPSPSSQHNFTLLSAPYGLPELNYKNQAFHLALCSQFLFWYSDLLSEDFHVASLKAFCRVATEVQIYPLIDRFGKPSGHLGKVLQRLQEQGIGAEVRSVAQPIQGSDNALLRLWTETCTVKPKKETTAAS